MTDHKETMIEGLTELVKLYKKQIEELQTEKHKIIAAHHADCEMYERKVAELEEQVEELETTLPVTKASASYKLVQEQQKRLESMQNKLQSMQNECGMCGKASKLVYAENYAATNKMLCPPCYHAL